MSTEQPEPRFEDMTSPGFIWDRTRELREFMTNTEEVTELVNGEKQLLVAFQFAWTVAIQITIVATMLNIFYLESRHSMEKSCYNLKMLPETQLP